MMAFHLPGLRGLLPASCAARIAPPSPTSPCSKASNAASATSIPTGGGLRTAYGDVFAQNNMPAKHIDTGADTWVGRRSIRSFELGGDLRFDAEVEQAPHTQSVQQFRLQQARVYLDANVIPNRLLVYVDEQVAPGGALNREAYGRVTGRPTHEWYVKAGQMYLPFGLRLQDQTAFILQRAAST